MERNLVRVGYLYPTVLLTLTDCFISLLDPEWAHRLGHSPFNKLGSDVFLVASPSKVLAFVADAEVITQITTRRNDFPKPLEMYSRLDIYGKNLVATEGADWRMHRKLAAPSFGERNNQLVFTETLHNTQSLLRLWNGTDGSKSRTLKDASTDTMRWALYIISRAGFNVRVRWAHEDGDEYQKPAHVDAIDMGSHVPPGHEMSYREALSELLHNIMWTQVGPPEYLSKSVSYHFRVIMKSFEISLGSAKFSPSVVATRLSFFLLTCIDQRGREIPLQDPPHGRYSSRGMGQVYGPNLRNQEESSSVRPRNGWNGSVPSPHPRQRYSRR